MEETSGVGVAVVDQEPHGRLVVGPLVQQPDKVEVPTRPVIRQEAVRRVQVATDRARQAPVPRSAPAPVGPSRVRPRSQWRQNSWVGPSHSAWAISKGRSTNAPARI